jgi:hypothetical protein
MDHLIIEGVKPYDGRYPFDIYSEESELSTTEWGVIKRHAGYLPLTASEGFAGGDPELFACFAVIALRRAGKIGADEVDAAYQRIADAPFGKTVRIEQDPAEVAQEADAGPPPSKTPVRPSSSGDGSTGSSESLTGPLNGSGIHDSGSSPLPPVRSGI